MAEPYRAYTPLATETSSWRAGAAQRLREEIGTPLSPTERSRYDQCGAAARAAVADDAAFDRALQEGRDLTLNQAIELASEETAERLWRMRRPFGAL